MESARRRSLLVALSLLAVYLIWGSTYLGLKWGLEGFPPFLLNGIRNVYSSPVGAAGRVYITDLDGTTLVITHSDIPRILATNHRPVCGHLLQHIAVAHLSHHMLDAQIFKRQT